MFALCGDKVSAAWHILTHLLDGHPQAVERARRAKGEAVGLEATQKAQVSYILSPSLPHTPMPHICAVAVAQQGRISTAVGVPHLQSTLQLEGIQSEEQDATGGDISRSDETALLEEELRELQKLVHKLSYTNSL